MAKTVEERLDALEQQWRAFITSYLTSEADAKDVASKIHVRHIAQKEK